MTTKYQELERIMLTNFQVLSAKVDAQSSQQVNKISYIKLLLVKSLPWPEAKWLIFCTNVVYCILFPYMLIIFAVLQWFLRKKLVKVSNFACLIHQIWFLWLPKLASQSTENCQFYVKQNLKIIEGEKEKKIYLRI